MATVAHELRNALRRSATVWSCWPNGADGRADAVARSDGAPGRAPASACRRPDRHGPDRHRQLDLRLRTGRTESILAEAVETSLPTITAAGHRLNIDVPDEPIRLHADPMRLIQVFSNLLINAAKYTPANGMIDLHTLLSSPKW